MVSVLPASPPSMAEQTPAPLVAPPEVDTIQPPISDPIFSPSLSPTRLPPNPIAPPPATVLPPAPAAVETPPLTFDFPSPPTMPSVAPSVDTAPPNATSPALETPAATSPPLPPVGPGESPVGPGVAPGPINRGTFGVLGGGGDQRAVGHVSSGVIIGVGVVVGVLVVLGLVLLYLYLTRKRRKEEDKNCPRKTDYSVNQDDLHARTSSDFNHNDLEKGDQFIINFNLPKRRSHKNSKFKLNPWTPGAHLPSSCKGRFSYDELMRATKGFSEANLLGEGGFGYVHRGMLPNGMEIAVKQLNTGSHQGEREFQAELEIISRVHHKHLVTLLGYCTSEAARFLVYEFVPNNTLEFHLHGEGWPVLDWSTRMKMAIGSAKGLAYLHEDCCPSIIHGDIKAANILLDYNFQPKVSDFGLVKFLSDTNNPTTHVSTRVVGTFGYLAPEDASSRRLTEKSDVYSFGVILIELITGRPSIKRVDKLVNEALVDWARPLLRQAIETGDTGALIDPRLLNDYSPGEMESMISCAAACIRRAAWLRPRMSWIAHALERSVPLIDLYVEAKPSQSKLYNSLEKKGLTMALASPEHYSSQHSDSTSEYGLNHSTSSSEA